MTSRITHALADTGNPQSLSSRSRAKRWSQLIDRFPDFEQMEVLDLGGTPAYWRDSPYRPTHVTVVNLTNETAGEPWLDIVRADACGLDLSRRFDLVISNSLLEHVGGHER